MNAVDVVRRLHEHRAWANRKLLDAAAALSDEQLHQRLAIGQGSVWKSLVHMFGAEYVWLAALHGEEAAVAPGDVPGKIPGNQEGPTPIVGLAELTDRWTALDAAWREYLAKLADADLDTLVAKFSSLTGRRNTTRRNDILLHVATHAHYTVAQVMNMLRQLGVGSLPDPMLITLARQEAR